MLDSYQTQQWRDVPVERGPRVDNGSAGRFIEAVQQFRDLCNERDHAKKRVAELEEMVKSAEKSLTAMGEGLLREDEVFRLIAQARFIEAIQQFRDLRDERDHAKKRVAELEEMVKSAEKSLTAMGEGLLREDEVFRLIAQVIHQASTSVNGQMAATR